MRYATLSVSILLSLSHSLTHSWIQIVFGCLDESINDDRACTHYLLYWDRILNWEVRIFLHAKVTLRGFKIMTKPYIKNLKLVPLSLCLTYIYGHILCYFIWLLSCLFLTLTNLPHGIFGLGSGDEEICWVGVSSNLSKQIDKIFIILSLKHL